MFNKREYNRFITNCIKYTIIRFLVVGIIICCSSCEQKTDALANGDINIIPKPAAISIGNDNFEFDENTIIVAPESGFDFIKTVFTDKFKTVAGYNLITTKERPDTNYVEFILDTSIVSEGYKLSVNHESLTIEARDKNGFIYGLQTLRMLLPKEIESSSFQESIVWTVPAIEIEDSPRYKWRGVMLDVSRHFFDVNYIKKTLDRMSMLKLNTFHWHLVDDQGWRIQIKKYPKLTDIGAFRVDQEDKHWNARVVPEIGEKATYGGFYTQEDIKEVVAYADNLGITVVPEIEMPAHVMSAIASYPELSCFETPIMVPSGGVWPITEIYCAGKESTFEFLENVIDEVVMLFPSVYIHVGGDEATKTNWKKCPHCKKRMQEENLEDVEELQSYFIARMENYISSKGRKVIGWDEILEGGIAPGAAVMSWRGTEGGMEASEEGHRVVMTPGEFCYFDQYQGPQNTEPLAIGGYLPLKKVYDFDPIVKGMTIDQGKLVLGGQANLWSEYIPTASHSEYMLYPRLVALSETLWSSKENRAWSGFSKRIKPFFDRLDIMEINFSRSAYSLRDSVSIDMNSREVTVKLYNEFEDSQIEYTIEDQESDAHYIKYELPIVIGETSIVKALAVKNGVQIGEGFQKEYSFHKAVGANVTYHTKYNSSYSGQGEVTLVNVLRGSKNFHDGQWQAWLDEDVNITIDLGIMEGIENVSLGFLQNQGPDIYFPTNISVSVSEDNISFKEIGELQIPVENVNGDEIKDFEINFKKQAARYVKIKAQNGPYPKNDGGSWLFLDEVKIK